MAPTTSAMDVLLHADIGLWLNEVEGFFATLTKRGVFRSVVGLQVSINRFLKEHDQRSQAFAWTADPVQIIAEKFLHKGGATFRISSSNWTCQFLLKAKDLRRPMISRDREQRGNAR